MATPEAESSTPDIDPTFGVPKIANVLLQPASHITYFKSSKFV